MQFLSLPRPKSSSQESPPPALVDALEDILANVPAPHTQAVADVAAAADGVALKAAHRAALLSGSLALPPGPLGLLTVLPDLYLIWKVQRQMVADIFALHGRSADLTSTAMVHCLFRHFASHVLRDVAVRAGQRVMLSAMTAGTARSAATALGTHVARRVAGAAAGRWIPLAGAAAVGAYAYWDTLQVAKAARRLLADMDAPQASPHEDRPPAAVSADG